MASRDLTLCGMGKWAAVVRIIWGYPGVNEDTAVSEVWRHEKLDNITSQEISMALRAAVTSIGEEILGIKSEEVGMHLLRPGVAMSMNLGGCPVYTIMIIGRWSSNAF